MDDWRRWRRMRPRVAQRADAALRAVAKLAVALGRKIVFVSIDRVAAHRPVPCGAIIGAQLVDALFGIIAMIAVREFTQIALVLTHLIAAAGAIPGPVVAATEIVKDTARIVGVRRSWISAQEIGVASD